MADVLLQKLEALRDSMLEARAKVHAAAEKAGGLPGVDDAWDLTMLAANVVGSMGAVEAGIASALQRVEDGIAGRKEQLQADALRASTAN